MWSETYMFWLLPSPPLFLDILQSYQSREEKEKGLTAGASSVRRTHCGRASNTGCSREALRLSLHLGFTVGHRFLRLIVLGNQLIGLLHFILLNHGVPHFNVSVL